MGASSGCFESALEWLSALQDGPEDIDAPSCEGDDRLVVVLSLAALALIEGLTVGMSQGAKRRLIKDALEAAAAAGWAPQEPHSA